MADHKHNGDSDGSFGNSGFPFPHNIFSSMTSQTITNQNITIMLGSHTSKSSTEIIKKVGSKQIFESYSCQLQLPKKVPSSKVHYVKPL